VDRSIGKSLCFGYDLPSHDGELCTTPGVVFADYSMSERLTGSVLGHTEANYLYSEFKNDARQSLIPSSEFPLVPSGQSKLSTCFAFACLAATRLYASTAFSNGTISIGGSFKTPVSKPGRSWSSISPICRGVSP
jgi:hypothetical protein